MKRILWLGTCLLALAACDETKDPAPATGTAAPAAMTDEQLDAADIPVEEDFEEEAAAQINADNLDDEVAKLEAEIAAE